MESKMLNRIKTTFFLLLITPLLSQCVQTQDINTLDLRIRNLDNRLVKMSNTNQGGSIEEIQKKQAEMAEAIDQLSMDLLQIKGQLDESSHHLRSSKEEIDRSKSTIGLKIDELSEQIILLADQLNQATERINVLQEDTAETMNQAKAAEEKAATAEMTAQRAIKQQKTAAPAKNKQTKPEPKQIVAEQTKQKAGEKQKTTPKPKIQKKSPAASAKGPGKEIYDKGYSLFREKKFNDAYRTFADYIEKFPKGNMVPNARFWLGDCYYNQNEYELAILEYQKVIADFPSHPKAPAALLKQGLAFEKLKDSETARIVYKKLLADYSKSEQSGTAKKQLDSLK